MIPPGAHGGSCNVNGSRGSWDLLLDLVRGLEGGGGEGGRAGKNKCVRAWVEGELHVSVHVCTLHAHARGRIKIPLPAGHVASWFLKFSVSVCLFFHVHMYTHVAGTQNLYHVLNTLLTHQNIDQAS